MDSRKSRQKTSAIAISSEGETTKACEDGNCTRKKQRARNDLEPHTPEGGPPPRPEAQTLKEKPPKKKLPSIGMVVTESSDSDSKDNEGLSQADTLALGSSV